MHSFGRLPCIYPSVSSQVWSVVVFPVPCLANTWRRSETSSQGSSSLSCSDTRFISCTRACGNALLPYANSKEHYNEALLCRYFIFLCRNMNDCDQQVCLVQTQTRIIMQWTPPPPLPHLSATSIKVHIKPTQVLFIWVRCYNFKMPYG